MLLVGLLVVGLLVPTYHTIDKLSYNILYQAVLGGSYRGQRSTTQVIPPHITIYVEMGEKITDPLGLAKWLTCKTLFRDKVNLPIPVDIVRWKPTAKGSQRYTPDWSNIQSVVIDKCNITEFAPDFHDFPSQLEQVPDVPKLRL